MNSTNFFLKYNNQKVGDGQCVSLVKAYFQEVLGLPPFHGNAIDYFTNVPGFTLIKKTLFNWPQPGDIVVWGTDYSKPYGHVGIANWVRAFDFNCFEQNNPIGSVCHYQDHRNYYGVLGWLRPNPFVQPTLPKIPLQIARIGTSLPLGSDFQSQVQNYSSNKIWCVLNDYSVPVAGNMSQDMAYALVDQVNPKEKFVFIYYQGVPGTLYTTYYYPKRDCTVTLCPATDPKALAYELSNALQYLYDVHHGSGAFVEVADNWTNTTDDFIKSKFDSVSQFYT